MKAMILAGGKGTRVQPLTNRVPKPMIPIISKPIMEFLVEVLRQHGFNQIIVSTSYLADAIENYFREGSRFGVEMGYSFEGYHADGRTVAEGLGSAGGLKKIQDFSGFFDDTFAVLCGDALIDLDLKAALLEHRRKGAMASVITREVPWDKVSNYGVVVTDKTGRITQFQEKPKQEEALSNFISTGIYIFEPEVIDLIPSGVEFDIGSQLFPLLAEKGMPFYAQGRPFNWLDIGSVSDYWEVLQNVLTGEVNHMDVPGIQIEPGLWTGLNTSIDWRGTTIKGPVYIGSGVKIEAGATIVGPTWIGHGSHICEGAEIVRSVLFEYTRVLNDVTLHEMIVFKDYSIDRAGEMKHVSECSSQEWLNARDRRHSRRTEQAEETDKTLEKANA